VSLTITGKYADARTRQACEEEARNAGIQLAPSAQTSGTLNFPGRDDFLESPGASRHVFAGMSRRAECRIALGKLTRIDDLVQMTKVEPTDCKSVGVVQGRDGAFMSSGNYESAVVQAQFRVRAAGGNLFVADAMQQDRIDLVVNGRGFLCPQKPEATPAAVPVAAAPAAAPSAGS
jgi:hypothetical protein